MGFVDHGPEGIGEPVAAHLRPGNAGSNTAADHITAARLAPAQLPKKYRRGRWALIRWDSAGGIHEFVAWLAQRGRWLSYDDARALNPARLQPPTTKRAPDPVGGPSRKIEANRCPESYFGTVMHSGADQLLAPYSLSV